MHFQHKERKVYKFSGKFSRISISKPTECLILYQFIFTGFIRHLPNAMFEYQASLKSHDLWRHRELINRKQGSDWIACRVSGCEIGVRAGVKIKEGWVFRITVWHYWVRSHQNFELVSVLNIKNGNYENKKYSDTNIFKHFICTVLNS